MRSTVRVGAFVLVGLLALASQGFEKPVRGQAVGFQPVVGSFPSGTTLTVTPAVTADRRYVRMSVNPFFNDLLGFDTFSVPAAVTGGAGMNGALGGLGGGGGIGGGGAGGAGGGGFRATGLGPLDAASGRRWRRAGKRHRWLRERPVRPGAQSVKCNAFRKSLGITPSRSRRSAQRSGRSSQGRSVASARTRRGGGPQVGQEKSEIREHERSRGRRGRSGFRRRVLSVRSLIDQVACYASAGATPAACIRKSRLAGLPRLVVVMDPGRHLRRTASLPCGCSSPQSGLL